jgi:crotonobetainyl-CoA:carnitine CoA-transferase CaiB-like acyl-CoA transferase
MSTAGPLDGVRVLEVGALIAGPFAGRILGDLGAEVIKVEAPGKPDPLREWGSARYRHRALWWPIQSRNKKLITLDLKTGRDVFLDLVRKSDVVLENFRPGTLERWGLGYDALVEANPKIVLARVSGYGQDGPAAPRAGFAAVAEAVGGLRHLNGYPDQAPPRTGISLGDSLGGMFALIGILAALYHRDGRGGRGQVVDVALTESCLAMLESVIPEYDRTGNVRAPSGSGLDGIAPSNIFESRDGKWMVIAANHDALFRRLCNAIGRPALAEDARFATHVARGENQAEIEGIVADWARQHDAAEIDSVLNEAGVACGPVNTIADVVADAQFLARDALVVHEDDELGPILGPGIVPRLSETTGSVRWSGPWQPGAHNREIYQELLGFTEDRLAGLVGAGTV